MLRIHSHFPSLVCKGLYYPSPTYPSYFSSCNSSLLLILLQPQWPLEVLNVSKLFPTSRPTVFSNRSTSPLSLHSWLLVVLQANVIPQRSSQTHIPSCPLSQDLVYFLYNSYQSSNYYISSWWLGLGRCLFVSVCMACKILVSWPWMEPLPPAVETRSLNQWTAREVHHDYLFTVCLPY